jgi:type I restriction enzyme M protein
LSNRKPKHRRGKVQLIDASQWYKPLRKNLGKKNCELSPEDIERICDTFLKFEETEQSKIFPNEAFGYRKIVVERPLRLHSQITHHAIDSLRFASGDGDIRSDLYDQFGDELFTGFAKLRPQLETVLSEWGGDDDSDDEDSDDSASKKGLPEKKKKKLLDPKTWERDGRLVSAATDLLEDLGSDLFTDHNLFREKVEASLKARKLKLSAAELKVFYKAVSWRDETAPEVVAKIHKAGKATVDPMYGFYESKGGIVEYESDPDLRDTEQVPLQEDVETFMRREVLPYTPDAWIDASATKIGYEISFTRHFYKPQPLRSLEEIRADILALERETEGMLAEIVGGSK